MRQFRYSPALPQTPPLTIGDGFVLLGIVAVLYVGARLAFETPIVVKGPEISLAPSALPWYALLSTARMSVAYILSLLFSLFYGYAAARNRTARSVLLPLLDVLQSVPILSFLPVVLLGLSAILPGSLAAELAAILLIFTSQAWNMTFSFYQSMTTLPTELREASSIFRLNSWLRFKTLELPFGSIGLLWNSMMSWAGGWFFLMAAESFHVGVRDFRLPGLGSYLQVAASEGDIAAVTMGLLTLITVIVGLDQIVWRPLIAWSNKFKLDTVEGDEPPKSWFLDIIRGSWLIERFGDRLWRPFSERVDSDVQRRGSGRIEPTERSDVQRRPGWVSIGFAGVFGIVVLLGAYSAQGLLLSLPLSTIPILVVSLVSTFLRVTITLIIALAWTIPVGVLIGTNQRWANVLQPIVQVVASIPATALFPVLLLALLQVPAGLNIAAIALMLLGTQWYILFNVIAGASAIPQDLQYTTSLLRLSTRDRWRTLILPALFPFIITGAITASGGAWNASIVAEYVQFGGQVYTTTGLGALISEATAVGNYALLLAATLTMVVSVVLINRFFWRRLYRLAEEKYRME